MAGDITLLDGGMGRELKRIGAPFKQPEWSALALIEGPDFVAHAHQSFVAAGADVITTNSYALVPFHLGEERFAARGRELAELAGRIARQVADRSTHKVAVAGSLPPLFGSYRPDLYNAARAQEIIAPLVAGLAPHVDHWLVETQSAIAEVEAAAQGLAGTDKPVWFSFTLEDGADDAQRAPRLRSGEAVGKAVQRAAELGAAAILFNCSQPEVMGPALDAVAKALPATRSEIKLGIYANAFPPQPKDAEANSTLHELRADLDPSGYLGFVQNWIGRGATIVGGCCGIGPEHIAALRGALKN
ncbi:MAG TPA: homocysteine S-methyltransferase family protein [Dongiaceae bacterium]|nr:homocysteine S-methyltransferase family protein [Dongiaceae bacterium]